MSLKNNYRPEIDGLRSLAVISVVIYHLDIDLFPGGFVGVDMFFVISGFLITKLIKDEIENTGSFDFRNFYIRRFKRLFPALFTTLFFSTFFATILLSPTHLQRFGASLASSLASTSNFYFWLKSDYFDISSHIKPLLHTWSLSIEEQFYLIWPLTIFLIYKRKKKWLTCITLLLVGCMSLYLNTVFSDGSVDTLSHYSATIEKWISNGRSTIFFLMPFRGFEFTIGAILVFFNHPRKKIKVFYDFIFFIGMGLILYSISIFDDTILYPSYFALIPCCGTALLIFSGQTSRLSLILKNKLAVRIGLISYSLYLIHWPVIVFYSYAITTRQVSTIDKLIMVILSFYLSHLSFRYIESPFRYKKIAYKHISLAFSLLAISVIGILGINMNLSGGWPWRISPSVSVTLMENASEFHKVFYGGAGYPTYGPVDTEKPADIVIMGDSHGRHYAEGIYQEWAKPDNKSLYIASGISFIHLPSFTRTTAGGNWQKSVKKRMKKAFSFIDKAETPPIVIISHYWIPQMDKADLLNDQGERKHVKITVKEIISGISALKKRIGDSPLVVIGMVPTTAPYNLYDVFTRPHLPFLNGMDPKNYITSPIKMDFAEFNQQLSEAAQQSGEFIFLDPFEVLCKEGYCRNTDSDGRLLYSDKSHLSKFGSRYLIQSFLPKLKDIQYLRELNTKEKQK